MKNKLVATSMVLALLIGALSIAVPITLISASPSSTVTVTPFVVERNLATGSWISFSKEQTVDGDYSVKMHLPGTDAGRYDQGLKTGIESPYSTLDAINASTLSFKVYGTLLYEGADVHSPYTVIVVDTGVGMNWTESLVFMHPTSPGGWGPRMTVTGTGWMDASPAYPDEWIGWFANGTELGVHLGIGHVTQNLTEWHSDISASYPSYTVLHLCIQYGFLPSASESTAYVDDLTVGTTYNFEPTTEVWVDDDWATAVDGHGGESVDGHTFGRDAFATIQDAIDAVAVGGTVIVHGGTYIENVNINKSLILNAASRPVIDGNQTGPCITIAADGVTVDGFELTNGTYGVASWGTDNSVISNNTIHDNLNIPGYAGIGIMFWSDSDDFDNNTISGNEIYNNDRQGIYIGGTTSGYISENNTISGNTIYNNGLNTTGLGPPPAWWADMYGIQLSFADNNTIVGNEIYGHDDWFPWGGTTFDFAQGIYLFDSNHNTIKRNYLHDNNYGVGIWRPSRAAGTNYIHCNKIAGNTGYGVRTFDAPPNVDARYNWWGDPSGPYHPTTNPSGTGDNVSDNVDYTPWRQWNREDINDDGAIDIVDIVLAITAFGSAPVDDPNTPLNEAKNWNPAADVNQDGIVDIVDLVMIAIYFGEKCL
ncbi:MAG: right-handed parallel beta-helix repeat-containing protein [Candidatus Bathyarchaeia archaeon]